MLSCLAHHYIKVLTATAEVEDPGTPPRPKIFQTITILTKLFHGNEVYVILANIANKVVHRIQL